MQPGTRNRKFSEYATSPGEVGAVSHRYGPTSIGGYASVIQGNVHHHHQYSSGIHEDQHRIRVADWYSQTDFADQQNDLISRREQGTSRWFLSHTNYQNWCHDANATLFCPGIPGSGKSMIVATVVDDLCARFGGLKNVAVIYLYCNFNRQAEQNFCHILRILIRQLFQEQAEIPEPVQNLYQKHRDRGTRPSGDELQYVLRVLILWYHRVFVVIDALDECRNTNQERDKLLKELFALQTRTDGTVNIFATGRPIPEIKRMFSLFPNIEIRAHNEDLELYMTRHMGQLPRFVLQDEQLQDQIKRQIINAAEGMFLLAHLQFNSLGDKLTQRKLKDALARLEKGFKALDSAYNDALYRIDHQPQGYRDLARKVLLWITYAKRELTIEELQEAIAFEPGQVHPDPEDLTDPDYIVSACQGLVEIDQQSRIVRLIHYTTQEYFLRVRIRWLPDGDLNIARICMSYLSMSVFHDNSITQFNPTDWASRYKLSEYAGKYWGWHARAVTDGPFCTEVSRFLVRPQYLWLVGELCWDGWNEKEYLNRTPDLSPLHIAAIFGLEQIVRDAIYDNRDINSQDSKGRTPLYFALFKGHAPIVQLLLSQLDTCTDWSVNTRLPIFDSTPLSIAASLGHADIVQLLLARVEVDVNAADDLMGTPLCWAVLGGYINMVALLLARADLNVNSRCLFDETALILAASAGNTRIVELLLTRSDLQLHIRDVLGDTALDKAIKREHSEIVELLSRRMSQEAIARESH